MSPYGGTVPLKMTNLPWFTHIHVVPISKTQKYEILKCEECFCSYCESQGGQNKLYTINTIVQIKKKIIYGWTVFKNTLS